MKLKAYFNSATQTVQVRLAGDAAPGGLFNLLGDIVHETPDDNASGMQGMHLSHVIKQHVDELLYTKLGIQTTQLMKIEYAGGVKPLTSLSIDSGQNTIKVGQEGTITVRLEPAGATLARPLTITPTKPSLIEIISNSNGVLKYKGVAMGDLFFHVKVEGFFQQVPVKIEPTGNPYEPTVLPASLELQPLAKTLNVGQTQQLTALVLPSDATDKTVTYVSGTPAVATVDSDGLVKAVGKGTSKVKGTTANGKTAESTITVRQPATSITVDTQTHTMKVNETKKVTATVLPANAETADKVVTWTTSAAGVATVGTDGTVTGKGVGTADITGTTGNGLKAVSKFTIQAAVVPVTGVQTSGATATVKVGETVNLGVQVVPTNATNKAYTCTPADTTVATANTSGIVTGVKEGETDVVVKTTDGNKTATVKVTVTAA